MFSFLLKGGHYDAVIQRTKELCYYLLHVLVSIIYY